MKPSLKTTCTLSKWTARPMMFGKWGGVGWVRVFFHYSRFLIQRSSFWEHLARAKDSWKILQGFARRVDRRGTGQHGQWKDLCCNLWDICRLYILPEEDWIITTIGGNLLPPSWCSERASRPGSARWLGDPMGEALYWIHTSYILIF